MVYERMTLSRQLPKPGTNVFEDLRLDMKMVVREDIEDSTRLARQVAAFSNTAGGVILVGAVELPKDSGRLHRYESMPYEKAQKLDVVLAKSLRRYCSPMPIADVTPIPLEDNSEMYVAAINCEPYVAPPIGVADAGHDGGKTWWAFPVRRGNMTHYLRPEELATIMEPKLRRMLLLIDRIPRMPDYTKAKRVYFVFANEMLTMDIADVDSPSSTMRLVEPGSSRAMVVPLDAIEMIWRDAATQLYRIALRGRIGDLYDKSGYEFHPSL